jgi:hypothetical protein
MKSPKSTTVNRKCRDSILVGIETAIFEILPGGPTTTFKTVGMTFVQFATIEKAVNSDEGVVRREESPPADTV